MSAIFLIYLLVVSIGVGVDQVHKAKQDCYDKIEKMADKRALKKQKKIKKDCSDRMPFSTSDQSLNAP